MLCPYFLFRVVYLSPLFVKTAHFESCLFAVASLRPGLAETRRLDCEIVSFSGTPPETYVCREGFRENS